MEYAVISEDYMRSPSQFQCVDSREFLYSTNDYIPTTTINAIKWEDGNILSTMVHPIASNGDMCITKELAEIIMSFDPYGIEVYPASLVVKDGEVTERYLLAINNIQDVVDYDKSVTEISPNSSDLIVHKLFLNEDKLLNISKEKKVIYRAKDMDSAVFFTPEIFDLIKDDERFRLVRKLKKDINMRAPKF